MQCWKTNRANQEPESIGSYSPNSQLKRWTNETRINKALTMLMRVLALAALGAVEADNNGDRECARQEKPKQFFKVFPVGTVQKKAGTTCLKIAEEYADALKGLDGFSHVVVHSGRLDRSRLRSKLTRVSALPRGGSDENNRRQVPGGGRTGVSGVSPVGSGGL